MSSILSYLNYLDVDSKHTLVTKDGKSIEVLEFCFDDNEIVLSEWAKHFRNQYCRDDEIDTLRNGTGLSRAEYLMNIKFPDSSTAPGPSIRSGDFGEILVSDYIEYILNYWVPRTRYANKTVRNESTKGCDIIGFRIIEDGKYKDDDTLIIFEAKAQLVTKSNKSRLETAVVDSKKDPTRKAESLNAIKQRLIYQGKISEAKQIDRFQNSEDHPYKEIYGASAIISTEILDTKIIADFDASDHPSYSNLRLLIIHGTNMMNLVNELFKRAADEA